MGFKLKPDATFPFTAQIPNGDAPLALKLRGKRKSKDELVEFVGSAAGRADLDLLSEALDGWDDVDADFGRDTLATLLHNYSGAGMAIFRAYMRAHSEAERKN